MDYVICSRCGLDLVYKGDDIWTCPRCAREYIVDAESIVEVNKYGEKVTKPVSKPPPKPPPTPKIAILYYIISLFSPLIGFILGAVLWKKRGMRSVARTCIYISLSVIVLSVVFVVYLWLSIG